jgi:hypothetical protein
MVVVLACLQAFARASILRLVEAESGEAGALSTEYPIGVSGGGETDPQELLLVEEVSSRKVRG